ncbi:glycoside hydrolase family 13 protein [Fictibacillus sp. KU28468]|uniref:glycoside hydrolase family 13 protein n=1 Tax=Fictibacillus sp. KU28468 TaxID=2991053 RepID=UPI00223D3CEE|nr:alpha-glucosidase [Fictibacillus sp. KU28468]UZJ77429.1 alpha-glucosidase [Fictibacillus sp. KU28468]
MKKKWWKESVVYQIYPRSFMDSNGDGIGDLQGIISKMDYLKDLGIDVIWLSPVYKSPNDDNGYDISDYQEIMDDFGTMEDWEEMLAACHERGIKLIMDLVINHTSDEHPWFIESRSSKDNPYRDFYIWREGKGGREPNNWESIFSGSAWQYDEQTDEYYLHLFSTKQPDLNWENEKVRQKLYELVQWWVDKGIDGFRVDAITHIKKAPGLEDLPNPGNKRYVPSWDGHLNQPGIQDFLKELKENVFMNDKIMTVGETPGVSPEGAREYVDEEIGKFNMVFQFEHMGLDQTEESKWDLAPWKLSDLKDVLTKWQKGLEGSGWNSLYLENHDQPRSVSRFGNDKEYHNKSAKMLAAFYQFMQGTPYIYQGQEIGMTNVQFESIEDYRDVEILNLYREAQLDGKSVPEIMKSIYVKGRDNARTPMQWKDAENGGFSEGTPWISVNPNYPEINVVQQLADENSILNFYKKLIQLRKEHSIIVYGTYDLVLDGHPDVYAYTRTLDNEKLTVLCNFSSQCTQVELPESLKDDKAVLLISNYEYSGSGLKNCELQPFEVRVFYSK